MSSYIDLSTLHTPTPASEPPASWGAQIRENFEFLYGNRRVICTSATRPTGFEGLEIYETDTDRVYIYDGSTWVLMGNVGAWTSFTPTLTQSGTVTKTVNNARYNKIGRQISAQCHMTVTGSGTGANAIVVGLPLSAASFSGTPIIGTFWCYDVSGTIGYHGALVLVSASTAVGWAHGLSGNIGSTPNFGLATNDQVGYSATYEADS